MSDTRYTKRTVPGDYDDLTGTQRRGGSLPADDPLAELARLIDEDPFADFNSRRRDPAATGERRAGPAFVTPPVEVEEDYQAEEYEEYAEAPGYAEPAEPELPIGDDLPEATDYDRESTERLYADLAAASQRVEPSFGRDYRQAAAEPIPDARYDPAAALEAGLESELAPRGAYEEPSVHETEAAYADTGQEPRTTAYEYDTYAETDPVFDEAGYVPPYEGEVPVEAGGRRKGTMIVAGLLGLIVVGGASALAYRTMSGDDAGGPPPVIRADKVPAKLQPANTADEQAPQQGKLVYDRVGGDGSSDETKLVSREEPVADVGNRQVRVIDTNQEQGTGLRGAAPTGEPSAGEAGGEELPKRVRTVVVKPDGTIVGEIEAPKAPEPIQPAPLQAAPLQPAPLQPAPLQPAPLQPAELPGTETTGTAGSATAPAEPVTEGGSTVPIPEPRPAEIASAQPAAVAPAPAATPAPVSAAPKPTTQPGANFVPPSAPAAAKPQPGKPLQLNPDAASAPVRQQQAPAPAAAPAQVASAPATAQPTAAPAPVQASPFPAGSYVVQVAASRSEQDAQGTAASINQRYGAQLSGYAPAVERADLGDRGIYYRVGVGPMKSQGDANALCAKLKSAGLDCFVRRN